MKYPSPAIVSQDAVRRLPRWALLGLCLAYVLPGFVGRQPWKHLDITSLATMDALAHGQSAWWSPGLWGTATEPLALLPYWLGAWVLMLVPGGFSPEFTVRVVFMGLLAATLAAVWYGTYFLARSPMAQPVAFAFGGEAQPQDYARAVADGGLLAFIASLGLAEFSHETTPALVQLCCSALMFYATAALPYRWALPGVAAVAGTLGLTLSGAPTLALTLGLGSVLVYWLAEPSTDPGVRSNRLRAGGMVLLTLLGATLATRLDLWQWRMDFPGWDGMRWASLGRLLLWFTWPSWPLALWTLWRWRYQLGMPRFASRHLWLPFWAVLAAIAATVFTRDGGRSLLVGLPALAALAAFALPTLSRNVSALIDWFTLVFFSGCAIIIWVVWLSMQTGMPERPALNVAKLAPGFEHSFSPMTLMIAVIASLAWAWLVKWRVGKHRMAIWKSLVLPASGATLCWLLLMSLWLPLLDYARSYQPMVQRVSALLPPQAGCLSTWGLRTSQMAALSWHAQLALTPWPDSPACEWLIARGPASDLPASGSGHTTWHLVGPVHHPAERNEKLFLYRRHLQ